MIPELVPFAEKDGKVIGFGLALPDLNSALIGNRSGGLLRFLAKIFWLLKTRRIRRCRILLLGILPEWRGKGVDAMLYHWIWTKAGEQKIYWGEAGWILEDNPAMNAGLEKMSFRVYKTYRLYDRADMKALVTGATGFVGSHLVDRLLAPGHEVTALVRSPAKAAGLEARGVRLVKGDLHDEAALREAVRGQDVVYHVAGARRGAGRGGVPRANRDGTANIVRAMEQLAPYARLVHVSSLAAAGPAALGSAPHGGASRGPGHHVRPQQERRGAGGTAESPALGHRPAAGGVRTARPRNSSRCSSSCDRASPRSSATARRNCRMVYAPDLARSLELIGSTPGIESRAYFTNHPEDRHHRRLRPPHRPLMGRDVRIIPDSAAGREAAARCRGPGGGPDGQPDDPPGRQGARLLLAGLDR